MVPKKKKSVVYRQKTQREERNPRQWGRHGNPDCRGALSGQTRAHEVPATLVFTVG